MQYFGKLFGHPSHILGELATVPTRLYYSYNELRLRLLKAKQKIQITKEYK